MKRKPFWVTIGLMVIMVSAYIFLLPQWQVRGEAVLQPQDLYGSRLIDVVVFSWCLWIGSSIGSFLNVVAWRMPRGESINGRSHCPRCMSKLRARDNVPVLGWLSLGGRCYCCRLPISIRYPIVELAVGISLSVVCFGQLYQLSLPRQVIHNSSILFASPIIEWHSSLVLIYHLLVLSLSWAAGLIRLDGHRLPLSLMRLALFFAILPMMLDPSLMVVPWQAAMGSSWLPDAQYLDSVMRILTSFVAAMLMGRILVPAFCPTADLKLDPLGKPTARLVDLIFILALPSIVVGWHSLPGIVVLSSVFATLLQPKLDWKKDALGCFAVSVPAAFTMQLVFWRVLHAPMKLGGKEYGTWYWPSESGVPWVLLTWAGMTLLIPLWLRDFERPTSIPADGEDLAGEHEEIVDESCKDQSTLMPNNQEIEGDENPLEQND